MSCAMFAAACGSSPPPVESTKEPVESVVAAEYALSPGDVFDVRVYGEEGLSGPHQVGPDGTVDFPFLGSLEVGGKAGPQVAQEIAKALQEQEYLKDPHVSVFVQEMKSKRISIVGAVAKPGSLTFTPGMTLVQAVSLAGGFSALANRDATVVTRREDGSLRRYTVAAGAVTKGNADDFPLRPGDIVFVPERIF